MQMHTVSKFHNPYNYRQEDHSDSAKNFKKGMATDIEWISALKRKGWTPRNLSEIMNSSHLTG